MFDIRDTGNPVMKIELPERWNILDWPYVIPIDDVQERLMFTFNQNGYVVAIPVLQHEVPSKEYFVVYV